MAHRMATAASPDAGSATPTNGAAADGSGRRTPSAGRLTRLGVAFRGHERAHDVPLDPIPRVITAADWERVKAGLAQRARRSTRSSPTPTALRRIVADGRRARRG